MPASFAVLLYVNRSGSTLLSRLLSDGLGDIYVFPEMSFPLDIIRREAAVGRLGNADLIDILSADPRLDAHALDATALDTLCDDYHSYGLRGLLTAIAGKRTGRSPAVIVIKLESYLYSIDALDASLGPIRVMHITRDVRGVASSMLKTPVPEKPGFNMARDDIVYVARHWSRYLNRVGQLSRDVLWIRYEDLVANPGPVLTRSARFLDLEVQGVEAPAAESRYALSSLDLALHPKVFQAPDATRLQGWKNELTQTQISVISRLSRDDLFAQGYETAEVRKDDFAYAVFYYRYVLHSLLIIRHYGRTAAQLLKAPGGFSLLIRKLIDRIRMPAPHRIAGNSRDV